MNATTERIPELKIEHDPETNTLMLEQEWSGNVDRIELHPLHVRLMAEKIGLLSPRDNGYHPSAATLTRRLLVLRERINHLAKHLALYSDHDHADLDYETDYANATSDIAIEFCADFAPARVEPGSTLGAETPPETGPLNTAENGAVQSDRTKKGEPGSHLQNLQERGDSLFELEA